MYYYEICLVVAFILSLIFVCLWEKRFNPLLSMLFMLVPIINLGYWQLSEATNLESALMANKVCYLGGCYGTLLFSLNIVSVCKIYMSKFQKMVVFIITTFVYGMALTQGYTDWFYKSASFDLVDGSYVFMKDYGPMHTVFYVMMVCYFGMGVIALIYSQIKKLEISKINVVLMILIMLANLAGFFGTRMIGSVELMPLSYDISLIMLLIISSRIWIYDTDDLATEVINRNGYMGVVSVDLKHRYLGSNKMAKKMYPALMKLSVDRKIKRNDNDFTELTSWIREIKSKGHLSDHVCQIGANYYKVTGNYLFSGKKKKGYTFIIVDWNREKKDQESLIQMSMSDSMTGLYNKRAYTDEIDEIKKSGIDKDLCLIAVDLNNLKKTNDEMGHSAGDELIEGAGQCLNEAFGEFGNVYRTGGDEFMVIAHCSQQKLKNSIEALDGAIASWNRNNEITLSLSKGVTSVYEFHYYEIEDLEKVADERMYKDKNDYYKRTGIERRRF